MKRIQGFSCSVAKSKFVEYCRAYSHNKMARAPTIETTVTLSPTTCMTMVNTERYTIDNGQQYPVNIQSETVIHAQELGVIEDDKISCHGLSINIDGHIIDDIVIVSQYRVTIIKE